MVKIPAVLDCACLIGLERIGHLDLLPALLHPVIAPPAVILEFGNRPDWLEEEPPTDTGMVVALRLIVDPGESEAIALAYHRRFRPVADDRKAREATQPPGIPFTGTVGLLLKAKEAGLITAILPLMDALDRQHFRISQALRTEALRLAGE